jgi:hypothetical protein
LGGGRMGLLGDANGGERQEQRQSGESSHSIGFGSRGACERVMDSDAGGASTVAMSMVQKAEILHFAQDDMSLDMLHIERRSDVRLGRKGWTGGGNPA